MDPFEAKAMAQMKSIDRVIHKTLYSRVEVEIADSAKFKAFGAKPVTDAMTDSNWDEDFKLDASKVFVFDGINVILAPDVTNVDAQKLLKEAILEFKPNNSATPRRYPLERLGSGGGLIANQLTAAADQVNNGTPSRDSTFRLSEPEVIVGGETATLKLHWATAPAPAAASKITVVLEGKEYEGVVEISR